MLSKLHILVGSAVLASMIGGGLAYFSHQRTKERQTVGVTESSNEPLSNSLTQMQHQLDALRQQVADLSAAKTETSAPPAPAPMHHAHAVVRTAVRPREQRPAEDPRVTQNAGGTRAAAATARRNPRRLG